MASAEITERLLAMSRNHFASARAIIQTVLLPESGLIEARIDIQEPLYLTPGEVKDVPFSYRAGIPHSTHFQLKWFITQEDADALENELTEGTLPTYTIMPGTPLPDTGEMLFGTVRIEAPNVMEALFYGALCIYQPT